jgi:antirestriction protein
MASASTTLRPYTQQEWFVNLSVDTQLEVGDMIDLGNYPANDIEDFINEFGESAFNAGHYKTWENLTEIDNYPYNAVEAFVAEFGINEIDSFAQAYMGAYRTPEDFAEEYMHENYNIEGAIEAGLYIDWEATWENTLSYNYTWNGGYIFNSDY